MIVYSRYLKMFSEYCWRPLVVVVVVVVVAAAGTQLDS